MIYPCPSYSCPNPSISMSSFVSRIPFPMFKAPCPCIAMSISHYQRPLFHSNSISMSMCISVCSCHVHMPCPYPDAQYQYPSSSSYSQINPSTWPRPAIHPSSEVLRGPKWQQMRVRMDGNMATSMEIPKTTAAECKNAKRCFRKHAEVQKSTNEAKNEKKYHHKHADR